MKNIEPFWKTKALSEMTQDEWELLCDGCARCCLHKLEDIDTREIGYTNIVCRLLKIKTCRCADYENRHREVPSCVVLNPKNVHEFTWLPDTCAYRLLAMGEELAWWHPLVSGNPDTVHQAGISVRGIAISEDEIDMKKLEDHVVAWVTVGRTGNPDIA